MAYSYCLVQSCERYGNNHYAGAYLVMIHGREEKAQTKNSNYTYLFITDIYHFKILSEFKIKILGLRISFF